MYEEYSPSTNVDQILQSRGRNHLNKSIYARDEAGGIISAKPKKGVPLGDVWDIPYLNPKAKERTGYPTQKPVLLLERIIKLSTEEGETVLDPFCGSGTTLVASELLNRNSIGIDISEEAVSLSQERVSAPLKTSSTLLELGRESYRQADSEILGLLQGIDCVPIHRNKGIDAILIEQIDQKPVPVRVQRDHESLFEAASKLSKAGRTKGAKVMLLVATQENIDLGFEFDLPNEIQVINSPALEISAKLSKSPTRTHL